MMAVQTGDFVILGLLTGSSALAAKMLLAQATVTPDGTPTTIIGAFILISITLLGLIGWLVRYIFVTTIPERDKVNAETVQAQARAHEITATAFKDTFAASAKSWESATRASAESQTGVVAKLIESRDVAMDKMRDTFVQQMNLSREIGDERSERIALEFRDSKKEQTQVLNDIKDELAGHHATLARVLDTMMRRTGAADIFISAADAIYAKTLDGHVTHWNRAAEEMFGWRSGEMVNQSIHRIVPPDRHEEEDDILEKIRKGEVVGGLKTERITRDGNRVKVSMTVSPIKDLSGKIIGASSVVREAGA